MRQTAFFLLVVIGLAAGIAIQGRLAFDPARSSAASDAATSELQSWSVHPWAIPADGRTQVVITATISDPLGQVESVSLDLTDLGGAADAPLLDDGEHNDGVADDGTFGLIATAAVTAEPGQKPLVLTIAEQGGQQTEYDLGTFLALIPLDTPWPDTLVPFLGWGSGENTWQVETGLPWNYQARFMNWDWQSGNPNTIRDFVQDVWSHDYVPVITVEMVLGATVVQARPIETALTITCRTQP